MSVELRSEALTTFLEARTREGFDIETRTATQAVIVRRRQLFLLLRPFRPRAGDVRLVVSVDSDGGIRTDAAEPRRW
jgi:hypothetical protein